MKAKKVFSVLMAAAMMAGVMTGGNSNNCISSRHLQSSFSSDRYVSDFRFLAGKRAADSI